MTQKLIVPSYVSSQSPRESRKPYVPTTVTTSLLIVHPTLTVVRQTGRSPLDNQILSTHGSGYVEKGVQGERRQIADDCFALAMKLEHYNATHPDEEPLQIPFNFEEDIEEMKTAKGLDNDEAA